jgi:hypothetical protein
VPSVEYTESVPLAIPCPGTARSGLSGERQVPRKGEIARERHCAGYHIGRRGRPILVYEVRRECADAEPRSKDKLLMGIKAACGAVRQSRTLPVWAKRERALVRRPLPPRRRHKTIIHSSHVKR